MKKSVFGMLGALVLGLVVVAPAAADTINFDPNGGGDSYVQIDSLDWASGSGIAVGANAFSQVGDTFTFYYQANLVAALDSGGGLVYPNGFGGDYFTVVLGFGEVISGTSSDVNGVGTLDFAFDPNSSVNFFTIYANTTAPGDNLTGEGFTAGTAILQGVVVGTNYLSSFSTTGVNGGALDQAGSVNSYPTVTSVVGSGDTDLDIQILSYNTGYFTGLTVGSVLTFVTNHANANIPFDGSDPSACFFATAQSGSLISPTCTGGFVGVGSVGTVNGFGSNTMLQIDGNSAFISEVGSEVPEPATLTLLGLGLLGSAAARRRQLKNKKKADQI